MPPSSSRCVCCISLDPPCRLLDPARCPRGCACRSFLCDPDRPVCRRRRRRQPHVALAGVIEFLREQLAVVAGCGAVAGALRRGAGTRDRTPCCLPRRFEPSVPSEGSCLKAVRQTQCCALLRWRRWRQLAEAVGSAARCHGRLLRCGDAPEAAGASCCARHRWDSSRGLLVSADTVTGGAFAPCLIPHLTRPEAISCFDLPALVAARRCLAQVARGCPGWHDTSRRGVCGRRRMLQSWPLPGARGLLPPCSLQRSDRDAGR